jgi:hypothetical protein
MYVAPTELACNFLRRSYKDFAPTEHEIGRLLVLRTDLQINFGAAGSSQNLFSVFHQSDVQSCLQFRAQPREVLLRAGSVRVAPDST